MSSMRVVGVAVLCICLLAGSVSAQLIVDTTQQAAVGRVGAGAVLSFSEIEYKVDDVSGIGGNVDIQRSILGGYGAMGLTDRFDVYGVLGLIMKSEVDGSSDSGSGLLLAGGGRLDLMDIDMVDVSVYAQLEVISEDYGAGVDGTLVEVSGGVVGLVTVNDQLDVFAAVDLFPFSDGDFDLMGATAGFERDGLFSLRGGATMDLGSFWVRGEIALVGETTMTIGAGTYF